VCMPAHRRKSSPVKTQNPADLTSAPALLPSRNGNFSGSVRLSAVVLPVQVAGRTSVPAVSALAGTAPSSDMVSYGGSAFLTRDAATGAAGERAAGAPMALDVKQPYRLAAAPPAPTLAAFKRRSVHPCMPPHVPSGAAEAGANDARRARRAARCVGLLPS
jgi:hypothetical protein